MKNIFESVISKASIESYKDLDGFRNQILKFVFICIILIVSFAIIYSLISSEDLYKSVAIGLPIAFVAAAGLYILPRFTLDTTVIVTFVLMYLGIYVAGYQQLLSPGFVILVLNMILILTLFFIKSRRLVIVACLLGVISNILIIWSTSIFLHEYLIGSLCFLLIFYAISTLIYKYQEILIVENKNIQNKNQEIQLLLKETHHRVKNNLQTISSILYLQSAKMTDVEAKEAIVKGQYRIESMALVHKQLYQRSNLASIEMKEYISSLAYNLKNAHGAIKEIETVVEMESVELDINTAIAIGLILNEILTNAFEYGFANRDDGKIIITMNQNLLEQYVIEIHDNGNGDNSIHNKFGSKLIQLLTKQINASFKEEKRQGYWCQITLK